jgi:hypothetical protein
MAHPIPIHLRSDLLIKLCGATGEGWFGDKTEAALCEAVSVARDLVANAGRELGAGSKLPRLPVKRC